MSGSACAPCVSDPFSVVGLRPLGRDDPFWRSALQKGVSTPEVLQERIAAL